MPERAKPDARLPVPLLPAGSAAVACGVVAIAIFSARSTSPFNTAGGALLVGGAAAVTAAIFGFVFGFPRSLTPAQSMAGPSQPGSGDPGAGLGFGGNTNLEQISDWLTKILVGAGLTQIGQIPRALGALSAALMPLLGEPSGGPFGAALTVYFGACGFLLGFLWTRLRLGSALLHADIEGRLAQVEHRQDQAALDVAAFVAVMRALAGEADAPDEARLVEALRTASTTIRAQAYWRAEDQRGTPGDRARLLRTIPVFRALVALDGDERFHTNRYSLGCALRDTRDPAAALTMVNKAIEIRDRTGEPGWRHYEFVRALCQMDLAGDTMSAPDVREAILADLRAALSERRISGEVKKDPTVRGWAQRNGVDLADLATPNKPRAA